MRTYSLDKKIETGLSFTSDASDSLMVGSMRFVLAICFLLTVFIDPSHLTGIDEFEWLIFSGYIFHSLVLWIFAILNKSFSESKLVHWLDVCWYALIILFTGGMNSLFFPVFFFAIITSSFRWGLEEGARITIASAALLVACALASKTPPNLLRLLLRTTFMLSLGYMSAHWGESKVQSKRRLALLREVARLPNPRFGVNHTITSLLEKTMAFFEGSSCILVMQEKESQNYSLRITKKGKGNTTPSIDAEQIGPELASPLMIFSRHHIVAYTRCSWPAILSQGRTLAYDSTTETWIKNDPQTSENLAALLEACSFITAPLSLKKGDGRIYVVSDKRKFSRPDALFLGQIVTQAFPVIENIELLDRMVSEAASYERQKIASDLHDTTVQPYIGLKLGLSAVRQKASPDNPLAGDLDKLIAMTAQVIGDLRRYAGTFKNELKQTEPAFLAALRRKAAQVKEFYGIDIAVSVEGKFHASDRLIAEVLQIVNEGLSNICKHTVAQRGLVNIQFADEALRIRIENENKSTPWIGFTPRSITERAARLGGQTHVRQGPNNGTVVHIEIPI